MITNTQKALLFAYIVIVTFFSVLRNSGLIYIESIIVILCSLSLFSNSKSIIFVALSILLITFFGNFVAPMDNTLRFDSDYPSLHTLSMFGGFKTIDLMMVILGVVIFLKVISRAVVVPVNISFVVLLIFLVLGFCFASIGQSSLVYDVKYMFFVLRGLLLFFAIYVLLGTLDKVQLKFILRLAIFTCISLMFFAHVIHAETPMRRELFGFNVIVAFAGDEYGSIGVLLAAILLLDIRDKKFCYFVILACFVLAIFAGRKASVPYFFFVLLMVFFSHSKSDTLALPQKAIILSEHLYITLGLLVIKALDYLPLNLAFYESMGILDPTLDSLGQLFNSDWKFYLLGIGPFTKYPLWGLNSLFDHPFAFGLDAGELYKIKLWFFPFERAFLNFGFFIPCVFIIKKLFLEKHSSASFYISLYGFYLFFFNAVSVVMCLSLSLAFAAMNVENKVARTRE